MFANITTYFASLITAAVLAVGSVFSPAVQATQPEPPDPDRGQRIPGRLVERLQNRLPAFGDRELPDAWPYHGDRSVRQGLILAVVSAADVRPVEALQSIEAGQSIAAIAEEAGSSQTEVLDVFEETAGYLLERAVENTRLPKEIAETRLAWTIESARQMVDQPGLSPAYPGLHELHRTILIAAVRVSDLDRIEIARELRECKTLNEILVENDSSGQEAVEAAMAQIDGWLEQLTAEGSLSETKVDTWSASIREALNGMVETPGVHLAGKACTGDD